MRRVLALAIVLVGMFLSLAASAAPKPLVEFVTANVKEHAVELHVKTSLREPVIATNAAPIMPPNFQREELAAAMEKFGPYLLEHVQVLVQGRALPGKVTGTKILEPADGGVHEKTGLDDARGQVDITYELGSADPLTISFDVLGNNPDYTVVYSFDVKGPRSQHADLANGTRFTFDVVEAQLSAERGAPRVGHGGPVRKGPPLGSAALGLAIFAGICYIGWSVIKKRMGR